MQIFLACLLIVNMIVILEGRSRIKKLKHALLQTLTTIGQIPANGLTSFAKEQRDKSLDLGWKTYSNVSDLAKRK